jgi:BMFP domain-containing protein YqiC
MYYLLFQLRQVRAKLESEHATLKQRESELEDKLESSKEGREDSVIYDAS